MADNVNFKVEVTDLKTGSEIPLEELDDYTYETDIVLDKVYCPTYPIEVHITATDNDGNILDEQVYTEEISDGGLAPDWYPDVSTYDYVCYGETITIDFSVSIFHYEYVLFQLWDDCIVNFRQPIAEASGKVSAEITIEQYFNGEYLNEYCYVLDKECTTDIYYSKDWNTGDTTIGNLYFELDGAKWTKENVRIKFIKSEPIAFKVSGDSRNVTKVRVSMDDGKTWGVLYNSYYTEFLFELPYDFDYCGVYFSEDENESSGTVEVDVNEAHYVNGKLDYLDERMDTDYATTDTYYREDWNHGATTTGTIHGTYCGVEYSIENVPIKFFMDGLPEEDSPVYMVECENCGYEYNEDLSECPNCHGESEEEEEDPDLPECDVCGEYYSGEFCTDCYQHCTECGSIVEKGTTCWCGEYNED